MNMKRFWIPALLLALCLALPARAHETSIALSGTVEAGACVSAVAAFTGSADEVYVAAGDVVEAGDPVARQRTTKVYAPMDGTVAAFFADVGDDAGAASARYAGALFLNPAHKYTVYVEDKYAYESVTAMYPHLGDTVYLRCVQDGSHRGTGVITAITEEAYTVETTGGEFYPGEAARVYNNARMYASDRIGRGTALAADPVPVKAEGVIVRRHAEIGDAVEKGQLLLETVSGLDDPARFPGETIAAPVSGIVTEVKAAAGQNLAAGGVAARICPVKSLRVAVPLTEADLAEISVGDAVSLAFETIPGDARLSGTVSAIRYLPDSAFVVKKETEQTDDDKTEEETPPTYTAYVDFEATEGLRIGMRATVYTRTA